MRTQLLAKGNRLKYVSAGIKSACGSTCRVLNIGLLRSVPVVSVSEYCQAAVQLSAVGDL